MPSKATKNPDGSITLEVTKTERIQNLKPHQIIGHHLHLKVKKKNIVTELETIDDEIVTFNLATRELATDQILMREAEVERLKNGFGNPSPAILLEEISWWTNIYIEANGDKKELEELIKNAKKIPHDKKFVNGDKVSTPSR